MSCLSRTTAQVHLLSVPLLATRRYPRWVRHPGTFTAVDDSSDRATRSASIRRPVPSGALRLRVSRWRDCVAELFRALAGQLIGQAAEFEVDARREFISATSW